MLRAMPACRAGDVTGCLADESGSPGRLRPCNIRVNSAAFYWLNYRGMKMVEVEGLAPPLRLGVGQLPWLLGDTSKLALVIGLAPTDFPSTEG